MPEYHRAFAPGGTFFFTVVTENRARFLCSRLARDGLRAVLKETRGRWPFDVQAIVLLPDHLHTK